VTCGRQSLGFGNEDWQKGGGEGEGEGGKGKGRGKYMHIVQATIGAAKALVRVRGKSRRNAATSRHIAPTYWCHLFPFYNFPMYLSSLNYLTCSYLSSYLTYLCICPLPVLIYPICLLNCLLNFNLPMCVSVLSTYSPVHLCLLNYN